MSEDIPQVPAGIPNYGNYQPNEELIRLRKRMGDLLRMGAATPETFAQTMMQLWQETERRRQACIAEAEDHLRKYHAMVAQSHGFGTVSSIMYSVINGYATIEERKTLELAEREKEKAEAAREEQAEKAKEAEALPKEEPKKEEPKASKAIRITRKGIR